MITLWASNMSCLMWRWCIHKHLFIYIFVFNYKNHRNLILVRFWRNTSKHSSKEWINLMRRSTFNSYLSIYMHIIWYQSKLVMFFVEWRKRNNKHPDHENKWTFYLNQQNFPVYSLYRRASLITSWIFVLRFSIWNNNKNNNNGWNWLMEYNHTMMMMITNYLIICTQANTFMFLSK